MEARGTPEISVVLATHGRPIRLLWLLNALEEQTLDRDAWEVLVGYDADDLRTREILRGHPLAAGGLRALPTASTEHNAKRNAGWRAARAPTVVFTDDDCRPPEQWLANMLIAVTRAPGAIVQGPTHPDPDEWDPACAPLFSTQNVEPPTKWGQTCNIAYPRALLERLDGFDPTMTWAEDTDLLQRALEAGAQLVIAPDALTYHAVEDHGLVSFARRQFRWRHLPEVVHRHPALRAGQPGGGLFWKPTHPALLLGVSAALGGAASRHRWPLLLLLPWARAAMPWHGAHLRGRVRSLTELPRRLVIDLVELAALARGSWQSRTFFL